MTIRRRWWLAIPIVLAVALFFKFSRFLSIRNWDVLTLFLLVPGLLVWLTHGALRNAQKLRRLKRQQA